MSQETITLTREEHEQLVKDKVTLALLRNYAKNSEYLDNTIKAILGIYEEEKQENEKQRIY